MQVQSNTSQSGGFEEGRSHGQQGEEAGTALAAAGSELKASGEELGAAQSEGRLGCGSGAGDNRPESAAPDLADPGRRRTEASDGDGWAGWR